MKTTFVKRCALISFLLVLVLLAPSWAAAQTTFGRIVVFGTSLSDPGNAFALTKEASTPPYDTLDPLLIPSMPYAIGGHHFSNGATWVEQLARPLGLAGNTRPAFQGSIMEATNYAVGGARAREDGINLNLSTQVSKFLGVFGSGAPSDALYVVEIGGNDIRDALKAFAAGGNGGPIITDALAAIGGNIEALYQAGGRKFLVWNVPDLGRTPAIRTLGSGAVGLAHTLTLSFNLGLDALVGSLATLPDIKIVQLDMYTTLNEIVADPGAYGLSEVNTPCIMPDVPPFDCQTPDEFLFWDGIHPTTAVHAIIAQVAASKLAQ